jgi:charged multivesicular body protein 4
MSGWGLGWLGGGNQKSKDAPKKAILQLRGQLEMLNKREKHLQNQMEEQDALARKYVSTNKNSMYICQSPPRLPCAAKLHTDLSAC